MNKTMAVLILLALVAGVALGWVLIPRPPKEVIQLPPKVVEVEIESPETLARLAAEMDRSGLLLADNGKLLDRVTGLEAQVVELLRASTRASRPVDPQIFYENVYSYICTENDLGELLFDTQINAVKYKGLTPNDELKYGWKGRAICRASFVDPPRWLVLHDQPFDLSSTWAVSSEPPRASQRLRWYAGVQYALGGERDRVRLYGGTRLFGEDPLWGRFVPRAGVFVEANAAGVDLGVDW